MARGQRPGRYDNTSPNGFAFLDPEFELGEHIERIPRRGRGKGLAPKKPKKYPKKNQKKRRK